MNRPFRMRSYVRSTVPLPGRPSIVPVHRPTSGVSEASASAGGGACRVADRRIEAGVAPSVTRTRTHADRRAMPPNGPPIARPGSDVLMGSYLRGLLHPKD